jgi:hypothetical protein
VLANIKRYFLLASILHEVIETYQSVVKQQEQRQAPLGNYSSTAHKSQWQRQSKHVFVFDIPVTLGGYTLDEEVRRQTIVHVVHAELKRIESLKQTLEARHVKSLGLYGNRKSSGSSLRAGEISL